MVMKEFSHHKQVAIKTRQSDEVNKYLGISKMQSTFYNEVHSQLMDHLKESQSKSFYWIGHMMHKELSLVLECYGHA